MSKARRKKKLPPPELIPFLDALAGMVADAVVRELEQRQRRKDRKKDKDEIEYIKARGPL